MNAKEQRKKIIEILDSTLTVSVNPDDVDDNEVYYNGAVDGIQDLMEEYAKQKCIKQKGICSNWWLGERTGSALEDAKVIKNAPLATGK